MGLTPCLRASLYSCTEPASEPWSVSATAGISSSAARAASAGTRQAPSRIENSEWTWRWTKGAGGTGRPSYNRPRTAPSAVRDRARRRATRSVQLRRREPESLARGRLDPHLDPRPTCQIGGEPQHDAACDSAPATVPLEVGERHVG